MAADSTLLPGLSQHSAPAPGPACCALCPVVSASRAQTPSGASGAGQSPGQPTHYTRMPSFHGACLGAGCGHGARQGSVGPGSHSPARAASLPRPHQGLMEPGVRDEAGGAWAPWWEQASSAPVPSRTQVLVPARPAIQGRPQRSRRGAAAAGHPCSAPSLQQRAAWCASQAPGHPQSRVGAKGQGVSRQRANQGDSLDRR